MLSNSDFVSQRIKRMFVRGMEIRDIAAVEQISVGKVLHSLTKLMLSATPKQLHYDKPPWLGWKLMNLGAT